MTRATSVLEAVINGLSTALTGTAVVAGEDKRPQNLSGPTVVVALGDPGEADVTLSPRRYSYDHTVSLDIMAPTRAEVDAAIAAIDDWVEANRSLGGLTDWLEANAPEPDKSELFGTDSLEAALIDLVATYTLPSPLS